MTVIALSFSNHRPEALPYIREIMLRHQVVFLEEAADPAFVDMLDHRIGIDAYVDRLDTEYPEFSRLSCIMLRELYGQGIVLKQVEPYITRLIEIHELFAAGKRPADVTGSNRLKQVYLAEKAATGALIDFYTAAAGAPFPIVLATLTEIEGRTADVPHARDEWHALQKVNRLRMDECELLFSRIRLAGTEEANRIVDAYLNERGIHWR